MHDFYVKLNNKIGRRYQVMTPKGKLFTSNLSGLKKKDFDADVLIITRGGTDISGTELVRDLSPSKDLFNTYLKQWKNKPGPEWWEKYEERFHIEMKSNIKLEALRDVYKRLLIGNNVVLVCFCEDHRYCHRRLVGEFFGQYGIQFEELNPVTIEQVTLF